jgi:hypothetical protein
MTGHPLDAMVEFIYWIPRVTRNVVIGVTNRDLASGYYYLMCETDTKEVDLNSIIKRYKGILAFIVETRKGYHFYFKIKSKYDTFIYYLAVETSICDRGYLTIAPRRAEFLGSHLLVLRISPKYYDRGEDRLNIVWVNGNHDMWHQQVIEWINVFNRPRPLARTQEGLERIIRKIYERRAKHRGETQKTKQMV